MKDKEKLKANLLKVNQLLIDSDSTPNEKEVDLFRSIMGDYIRDSLTLADDNSTILYELEKIQLMYYCLCDSAKNERITYSDILNDLINAFLSSDILEEV